uniref:Uncharacterized protein n=1 Tax=Catagonus wagneri TaxID=51154 RepID=A0A8C3W6Y7_9CETA
MAEQRQMKTSFLFVQLQAPPARALPAGAPAWTAAAGGREEEGLPFPGARTAALGLPRGSAAPPLQGQGRGTRAPAARSGSAPKEEKEGEENKRDLDARRGRTRGSPSRRPPRAPAPGTRGRRQPGPCGPPSRAPGMGDDRRSPSAGRERWPVRTAPPDVWATDAQSPHTVRCSIREAQAADGAENSAGSPGGAEAPATCPGRLRSAGDTRTTPRARGASLCCYRAPLRTCRSFPAPPAALPLKVRKCISGPNQTSSWLLALDAPHLSSASLACWCPSPARTASPDPSSSVVIPK